MEYKKEIIECIDSWFDRTCENEFIFDLNADFEDLEDRIFKITGERKTGNEIIRALKYALEAVSPEKMDEPELPPSPDNIYKDLINDETDPDIADLVLKIMK